MIRQLVEYKKFKDAAGHLQAVETTRLGLFPRPASLPPEPGKEEGALADALALGEVGVFDLLERLPKNAASLRAAPMPLATADADTVIFEENFTVADQIERLRGLMTQARGQPLAFTGLFARVASRVEMVVTFLALLELVRLKQSARGAGRKPSTKS